MRAKLVELKVGVIILTLLENARMALRYDPLGRNYFKRKSTIKYQD
jgi:hypothetical protein